MEKRNINFVFIIICFIFINIYNTQSNIFIDKKSSVKSLSPNYENRTILSPKVSAYFEISPIHINNTDPLFDWETMAETEWCYGSGTYDNPYILENITINAELVTYGIWVENSDVFFEIRNCIIKNMDYGLILENTTNGKISNCSISDNNYYMGNNIKMTDCENILIENCKTFNAGYSNVAMANCENILTEYSEFDNAGYNLLIYPDIELYRTSNIHIKSCNMTNAIYSSINYSGNETLEVSNCYMNNQIEISASSGYSNAYYNISNNYFNVSKSSAISHYLNTQNPQTENISMEIYNNKFIGNKSIDMEYVIRMSAITNLSILNNEFENISARGIYFQNNNTLIEGNTFFNVGKEGEPSYEAINHHSWYYDEQFGENIIIRNNSFINCPVAIYCDNIIGLIIEKNTISKSRRSDAITFNCEIRDSCNIKYYENKFYDNLGCSLFTQCENISIRNNEFVNSSLAMAIDSSHLVIVENNVVKDNWNKYNLLGYDSLGLILLLSYHIILNNNTFTNSKGLAIGVVLTNDSSIYENIFKNISYGIILGLTLEGSSQNYNISIKSNEFYNCNLALEIKQTDDSWIIDNDFENNLYGIRVSQNSDNNTIYHNLIMSKGIGIIIEAGSGNNLIYYNHFDNDLNALCDSLTRWDNGTIGNYWSDYSGKDLNDDGIGDTAYLIAGGIIYKDNFPIWNDGISVLSDFVLKSYADDPDQDGVFWIGWTHSNNVEYYSIYISTSKDLSDMELIATNITTELYLLELDEGIYYIVVVAHNFLGEIYSNIIKIEIGEVIPEIEDSANTLTNTLLIVFIFSLIGSVATLIIYQYWRKRKEGNTTTFFKKGLFKRK